MAANSNIDLKKFCAVYFQDEDNAVAVVPNIWLTQISGISYMCKWPESATLDLLERLAREEKEPETNWSSYPSMLIHTSKSYSSAVNAMKFFQANKEVELFSPDTDAESVSNFLNRKKHFASPSTPKVPATSSTPRALMTPINSSASVIDVKCSNCNDLEKRLITIEEEISSLRKLLIDVKVSSSQTLQIVSKIEQNNIPQRFDNFQRLETQEDLAAFNSSLKDDDTFSKMILFFSAFGGKDVPSATRKIMSVLMSNALAINYNWVGTQKKRSFQEYKHVIELVAGSVRHNKLYENAPINVIDKEIAKWLRYASDREFGSRRKRETCAININSVDNEKTNKID